MEEFSAQEEWPSVYRSGSVIEFPRRLVTGCHHDNTAKIYDAATTLELLTLSGHHQGVYCLAWRHDGTLLATGSYDGVAKIWDAATGSELFTPLGP
jgi:WD40 repeat protein